MFLEKLILLKCFIPFSFYFFVFLFSFFFLLLHFKICAHFTNLGLVFFFQKRARRNSTRIVAAVGCVCRNSSTRYHPITQRPCEWSSSDLGVCSSAYGHESDLMLIIYSTTVVGFLTQTGYCFQNNQGTWQNIQRAQSDLNVFLTAAFFHSDKLCGLVWCWNFHLYMVHLLIKYLGNVNCWKFPEMDWWLHFLNQFV